ncbi:type I-E CRISPR-associated protein Cas7/Cse4/CasC [Lujinxingia sediminis]|uniref:Type I-E CRISPR-associated protein Cas7/Cse4/CasC n=1 Tax=Lujinxingia sediminis TaxID=2480984 RepID=A0ABY0CTR8_9DELT|nr:type I-E CRISPR-associated protein Cas7/Cse4/CasC [Lujinxingia sediminis]RVU45719.1 type I-E CRISPR-associated protein Cas7/Cse4/CasC [Lujinxingia sediminis]
MERFLQLHLLTSYPPANLNRDDLGRPKTAIMGGKERLRVSSQCLKRTWRTSDLFQEAVGEHSGQRTKLMGPQLYERLVEGGRTEKQALKAAEAIAKVFGEVENASKFHKHKQIVHFSPAEWERAFALAETLIEEGRDTTNDDLELLKEEAAAIDIAMFGRMLAKTPRFNVEAAVQVAHALTVHQAAVEMDFFTAVDDLNKGDEDAGSAHMGELEFGAGVFYVYVCIDRKQLIENLEGNEELAQRGIKALVEAAVKMAPSGKQNSFASRAFANYVWAEKGDGQPRSLSVAFLKPVSGDDYLSEGIKKLNETARNMDASYGSVASERYVLNAMAGEGKLDELLNFAAQ